MKLTHALPRARVRLGGALACTLTAVALTVTGAHLAGAATHVSPNTPTDGILITLDASAERALDAQTDGIGTLAASDIADELAGAGLTATGTVDSPDGTLVAAEPAGDATDEEALEAASELPGVAAVQYNYVYSIIDAAETGETVTASSTGDSAVSTLSTSVNDPFASNRDATSSSGNQYWLDATGLDDAWDEVTCDNGVTVAVIDTGAALDHEDLAANMLGDLAYDVTTDTPLAQEEVQDSTGHGTSVAGVVAATANNALGLAGASFNANILPIKVADEKGNISSDDLIEAYSYLFDLMDEGAVSNLRVINMSLGGYEDAANDEAFHDAIISAREDYGVLTVCAGGNGYIPEGSSTRVARTDAIYPSDFEECISVTALEPDGTNISWSDYNQAKDISAPGRTIWSTTRTHTANGWGYSWSSGTSEAAPMVSGTVALMFAAAPDATPDEVEQALLDTATPIEDSVCDRSQTSGSHGALNAAAAVREIAGDTGGTDEPVVSFTDVSEGQWYYESVMYVAKLGIMHGYDGDVPTFGPADALTREQAACVLYNYLGDGEIAQPCGLADVKQDYYTDAVNWAVAHGYIKGYQNADGSFTTFGVGDPLTREQLAGIIANIAQDENAPVDPSAFLALPDHADTSAWAVGSLQWALDNEVLHGVEQQDGSLRLAPGATVDRAQIAAIMMNCIKGGIL